MKEETDIITLPIAFLLILQDIFRIHNKQAKKTYDLNYRLLGEHCVLGAAVGPFLGLLSWCGFIEPIKAPWRFIIPGSFTASGLHLLGHSLWVLTHSTSKTPARLQAAPRQSNQSVSFPRRKHVEDCQRGVW